MNSLILLGASGSIGRQTLDVCASRGVALDALSVHRNVEALEQAVRRFAPRRAAVTDPAAYADAKVRLSDTGVTLYAGREGLGEMMADSPADTALNAIVGEAGLYPTLYAIENRKRLALANKESLVCGGAYVMEKVRRQGIPLLPVDSEHCAIHQCLKAGRREDVRELILTASGGPFFGYTPEALAKVTVADTLKHPTWSMGQKITVDSATLMNKGFELIEAAHLFGVGMDRISALIHRESIIHSMVRFADGIVIAQMGMPDMRSCIAYALFYPERSPVGIQALDLAAVGQLSFARPDEKTFPLLALAKAAFGRGGVIPAVLNAANEEAVAFFLAGKIGFCQISDIVSEVVHTYNTVADPTPENVMQASCEARAHVRSRLG